MSDDRETTGTSDDQMIASLFVRAEQTRLPGDPSIHDEEAALRRFNTWLDNNIEETQSVANTAEREEETAVGNEQLRGSRRGQRADHPASPAIRLPASRVQLLPAPTGSLARGLPPAPAGTLFVLGDRGGISVAPTAGFTVIFGRNEPQVHVCVGAGDPRVSRKHGLLRNDGKQWIVRNTGHLPIRLPGSQLLLSGHEEPLPVGYTPLFISTARDREHLLEVRVAGSGPIRTSSIQFDDTTQQTTGWTLSDRERMVLVALGQRYLRREAYPKLLSWRMVQAKLSALEPAAGWTVKGAEHVVAAVRTRLAQRGVPGLSRQEVGEPVGDTLNHNLIRELLLSTTLVPSDLRLLNL